MGNVNRIHYAVAIASFALAGSANAQTSTNCQTFGNRTQCTTIDNGAQQRQTDQAAGDFGSALGRAFAKKKEPAPEQGSHVPWNLSTGNGYYAMCQEDNRKRDSGAFGLCAGYLAGFLGRDAIGYGQAVCLPPGVENGQIMDVVMQWLKDNPQSRNHAMNDITALALAKAFPCPAR